MLIMELDFKCALNATYRPRREIHTMECHQIPNSKTIVKIIMPIIKKKHTSPLRINKAAYLG